MKTSMAVYRYLAILSLCAAGVCAAERNSSAAESWVKKTYTYKVVDDCQIKADVYRADDTEVRPVVVWLHGGALILGSRHGVPGGIVGLCRKEGFVLVSIDYRLAPEVKLPRIIEDIQDAFRWIRQKGPALFHADPDRIVVTGGSAGGYLTMMTGICVRPVPSALVAYWGYGSFDGEWYSGPSPYHGDAASLMPRDQRLKAIGGKVLTGTDATTQKPRGDHYRWLRQTGRWVEEISGFDPATEQRKLDPYCPVRNITPEYPPILMIHGTEDRDVPYEQSADMAKELARHNVAHELITIPGGGHGLGGGDKELIGKAHARALAFVKEHLSVRHSK